MFKQSIAALLIVGAAQSASADECTALLKGGVSDQTDTYSTLQRFEAIRFYLCRDSVKTLSDAKSGGINANIPIEGVLVGFGLTTSESTFQSAKESFCTASSQDLLSRSELREKSLRVNQGLVDGFVKCIATTSGLHASLETTQNPEQFAISFQYRSSGPPYEKHVTYIISPRGVVCTPARLQDPVGPGGVQPLNCTRSRSQAVLVTYGAVGGGGAGKLELPAYEEEPALVRDAPNVTYDYHMRWEPGHHPDQPEFIDTRHVPMLVGRGEWTTENICINATPGWLLLSDSVTVTPSSSTNNCFVACPLKAAELIKTTAQEAPGSYADCLEGANQKYVSRACFKLRMHLNNPGEICGPPDPDYWKVVAKEIKLKRPEASRESAVQSTLKKPKK